jgi:hypothetical protein
MAIASGSVVQINGTPSAGEQAVEVFDQLSYTWPETDALLMRVAKMGWEYCVDSTYTSGSPLALSNDRVLLPCDGLGATSENGYLPSGVSELWNTTLNKVVSANIGNAFEIRIQFTVLPGGVNDEWFDIEFDIGDGAPDIVIASRTITAPKGTSAFVASVAVPLFSLATFVTNGGKIYINTTGSGDSFDIYDISIMIKQDYYAN